jgi:DNA processing protein
LITARQAAEQGRDVFVVPGNIDVPTCEGSNALLREGAISVMSGWDVVSEYAHLYPERIRQDTTPSRQTATPEEVAEAAPAKVAQKPSLPKKTPTSDKKKDKKPIDNANAAGYSVQSKPVQDLSEDESRIMQLLTKECLVDDLVAQLSMPTGKVLSALTMLQIKGLIRQLPGNRVTPCE